MWADNIQLGTCSFGSLTHHVWQMRWASPSFCQSIHQWFTKSSLDCWVADFDKDTWTSWGVFMIWQFYFTTSSTTVVFWGLLGLWSLNSPLCCFFLRMYQIIDLWSQLIFSLSLMCLFSFSLMWTHSIGIDSSLDFILTANSNSPKGNQF